MASLTSSLAVGAAVVQLLVAASGGWLWWRVERSDPWWQALRGAQVVAVGFALYAGVLAALGEEPEDGLFLLYALLPVPVSFVAEQLRAVSAQTVLDSRGIEAAKDVGGLPVEQQRSIVTAILRREMGVMALSAGVVAFLLLRAAGSA